MPPKSTLQGVPDHLKQVAEILGGTAPKLVMCYSEASPFLPDTKVRLEAAAKADKGPVAPIPSFVPTGGTEAEKKALAATEATLNARKKAAAALSVPLLEWDCTPKSEATEGEAQLSTIRSSMGITVLPCLLALDNGELCDKLQGAADMSEEGAAKLANFISKFKEYCVARKERPVVKKGVVSMPKTTTTTQSAAGHQPLTTNMTVDVDKMVKMGRDMVAKRELVYAEKFFLKALGVLDVAASEKVDQIDENMEGSIAMTLAWVVIAQMLMSRPVTHSAQPAPKSTANNCEACDRLERDFEKWITPASQCSLAVALRELFRYLPCSFDPKATTATIMEKIKAFQLLVVERSMAKAQEGGGKGEGATSGTVLTDDEQKALLEARCQLVIIHLISLDVERAVTEAVKISASGHEFGDIAIKTIKRTYLGDNAAN